MNLNEYQAAAMRTASQDTAATVSSMFDTAVLGLNGESGEIAEIWKKHKYHGHLFDTAKVVKELGDVMWYIACACEAIGVSMEQVGLTNIRKLKDRYPEKFESKLSLEKNEENEARA